MSKVLVKKVTAKKAPVKKAIKKPAPKKVPVKKVVKKAPVKKAAPKKPVHPLMVNGKDWDRQKVTDHVCGQIATSTKSIAKIIAAGCNGNNLPDYSTFMKWLTESESLSNQYARAKEDQADFMAEEMLEISDNATNDWMTREDPDNPGFFMNGENVKRSRLRVDTRKWLASKLKPKKYGDRVEHSGSISVLSQVLDDLDGSDSSLPS